MEFLQNDFTELDTDLFFSLTVKEKINSGNFSRNAYFCNIDKSIKCNMHAFDKGKISLQRLFVHFKREHKKLLDNFLIDWLIEKYNSKLGLFSCSILISNYIKVFILPIYQSEKEKRQSIKLDITNKNEEKSILNIDSIDLKNLNQIILENGVYEHLPISTISSKEHISFISGFMKLGFCLGRNTNILLNDFLKICNEIVIPRSMIQKVGNDYFEASISYFKGSMAAFEIDAGKINDKEILCFVLSAKNRYQYSLLFDLELDFEGNFDSYQKVVRSKIQKAKENNITIVGLTTDNLPVQISALSHDCIDSIQNTFDDMKNIIHFRCTNHLLNLSYRDWVKQKNELSIYESKIKKIINILSKKEFSKKLSKKVPKICITRWNSAFRALEMIFRLKNEILNLYKLKNLSKSMINDLLEIKNEIKFIFTKGFSEVYPLLFHLECLIAYLVLMQL